MIPLFKPFVPKLPKIQKIIHSGRLTSGEYVSKFEHELKKFFDTPYLMVASSYSSAIDVVTSTINLCPGDEVIMSPMCCLASSQPYLSKGLKIVWADVDEKTGTLSPKSVREKITKKTKLIIHNHFCGFPGYIDEINQIGLENGIPVLDDGIECFGSMYRGKRIGNCGTDITVFSLSPVRVPNTIEGGIIICKDKNLYNKALLISDLGIDRKSFRDELGEINKDCDVSLIGFSAKMNEISGYIGHECMKCIETILQKQYSNSLKWDEIISEKYKKISIVDGCKPNYWVYGILSDNKKKTILELRNKGFYASGVHVDNSIYSVFQNQSTLPGVKAFSDSFVAIPCGWWVDEKDIFL